MNESVNSTRPPETPKSSRNNERQKALQDRLKLSWRAKPSREPNTSFQALKAVDPHTPSSGPSPHEVKGFGEQHFTDSTYDNDSLESGLNPSSSLWTEKSPFEQSVISKNIGGVRSSPPKLTVSFHAPSSSSSYAQRRLSEHSRPFHESLVKETVTHGPRSVASYKTKLQSHLSMSQTLHDDGLEGMVQSLLNQDAGFCYLERQENDFYQFGIKDTVPTSIYENQFTTMSVRGVLRATGDKSELVDFATLAREREAYMKLQNIKVFLTFRTWKTFLVWKKHVHRQRYERRRNEIEKLLMTGNAFCRRLILACRVKFEEVAEISVLAIDLDSIVSFEEFLARQRVRNRVIRDSLQRILAETVDILCSNCEDYVLEAAKGAPASMSQHLFDNWSLSHAGDSLSAIAGEARTSSELVELGTKFNPTVPKATKSHRAQDHHQSIILDNSNSLLDELKNQKNARNAVVDDATAAIAKLFQADSQLSLAENTSIPYTIRSAIRLRCRTLVALFRLIDYMLRDTVYNLIDHVLADLVDLANRVYSTSCLAATFSIDQESKRTSESGSKAIHEESDIVRYRQRRKVDKKKIVNALAKQRLTSGIWSIRLSLLSQSSVIVNDHDDEFSSNQSFSILGGNYFIIKPEHFVESVLHNCQASGVSDGFMLSKESTFISNASSDVDSDISISEITRISLCPCKQYCLHELEQVLRETALSCTYVEGLFFQSRCQNVFLPIKGELTSVFQTPLEDRIFLDSHQNRVPDLLRRLIFLFGKEFDHIETQSLVLRPLETSFHDNLARYEDGIRFRLANHTSEQLVERLQLWEESKISVAGLMAYQDFGLLRVDISSFRSVVMESVVSNLDLCNKLIPELYISTGDQFYREISALIDQLTMKYFSLTDFIKVVEAFQKSTSIMGDVDQRYAFIMSLQEIIEHRRVRISDAILRQNLTIPSTFNRFQLAVGKFEDVLDEETKKYRVVIQQQLESILVPINELQEFLLITNNSTLNEGAELDVDTLLQNLEKYRKSIEQVSQRLRQLDYYQSVLHVSIFERSLDEQVMDALNANLMLWNTWKKIEEISAHFMQLPFLDAPCDSVQKEVGRYRSDLMKYPYFVALQVSMAGVNRGVDGIKPCFSVALREHKQKKGSENADNRGIYHVFCQTLKSIDYLLKLVPLIRHLQSKILRPQHSRKIQSLLGRKIFDDSYFQSTSRHDDGLLLPSAQDDGTDNIGDQSTSPSPRQAIHSSQNEPVMAVEDITIGNLVQDMHIIDHKLELDNIFQQAQLQFNVQNKVIDVMSAIAKLELTFDHDPENRTVLYFANAWQLIDGFHSHIITLQSVKQSRYCDGIAFRVQSLIDELQSCLVLLQNTATFQKNYFRLRMLFNSQRVARSMSSSVKQLKFMDEIWRYLIKSCKTIPRVINLCRSELFSSLNDRLVLAANYVESIQKSFNAMLIEQCHRYPRLYCIDSETLGGLMVLPDIKQLYLAASQYMFGFIVSDVEPDAATIAQGSRVVIGEGTSFVAIHSLSERLAFLKPCIGRSNLTDWLKLMEVSMHDRIEKDIRELVLDHNVHPLMDNFPDIFRFSEQALVLSYQIKFWERMKAILGWQYSSISISLTDGADSSSIIMQIRNFHAEISGQLSMISSFLGDSSNPHHNKLVSNLLLLKIYYRDLLKAVLDAFANQSQSHASVESVLFFSMQKNYDAATNMISVRQGGIVDKYGMKYQGFSARLVILPIVDKCFFALNQAFRHGSSPVLSSSAPSAASASERQLLQQLHYELGQELLFVPMINSNEGFVRRFARLLQASVRAGLVFLVEVSQRTVDDQTTSFISNALASFTKDKPENMQQRIASPISTQTPNSSTSVKGNHGDFGFAKGSQSSAWTINGESVQICGGIHDPWSLPRVAFLMREEPSIVGTAVSSTALLSSVLFCSGTQSVSVLGPRVRSKIDSEDESSADIVNKKNNLNVIRLLFRPISVPRISFRSLVMTTLIAHNFAFVAKMSEKIDSMAGFLTRNKLLPGHLVKSLLFYCLKSIGLENEHCSANVAMQLTMIIKKFFSFLPPVYQAQVTNNDLRVLCNQYLEICFNPITDLKDFRTTIDSKDYQSLLYDKIKPQSLSYGVPAHIPTLVTSSATSSAPTLSQLQSVAVSNCNLLQRNKKKVVVVVGAAGVGKSTLIQETLKKLQQDQIQLKKDIQSGRLQLTASMEVYSIVLHEPLVNVALLFDEGVCPTVSEFWQSKSDSKKTSNNLFSYFEKQLDFCQLQQQSTLPYSVGARFCFSAETTKLSTVIEQSRTTMHYFHLEFPSSSAFSFLIPSLQDHLLRHYPFVNITLVCELTELRDLDPTLLVHHLPLLNISDRTFNLTNAIEKKFAECVYGQSASFRKVLNDCTELFIKPCCESIAADSELTVFALVRNVFSLISALFNGYVFPSSKGRVVLGSVDSRNLVASHHPYDDNSVKRIVLFACIWTFGVCGSASSKKEFDSWFKNQFASLNDSQSNVLESSSVLPSSDSGCSVFDFVLVRQDGPVPSLQWWEIQDNNDKQRERDRLAEAELHSTRKDSVEPPPQAQDSESSSMSGYSTELVSSISFSLAHGSLMVASKELRCLAVVHAALSHSLLSFSNRKSSCLLLTGPRGSGKTSLLHQLLQCLAHPESDQVRKMSTWDACHRWIVHWKESCLGSSSQNTSGIQKRILTNRQYMLAGLQEKQLPAQGAIFVEDLHLNIEKDSLHSDFGLSSSSETVLRQLIQQECIFDLQNSCWVQLPATLIVATSNMDLSNRNISERRFGDSLFNRMKEHCFVHVGDVAAMKSVFTSVLLEYAPSSLSLDIFEDLVSYCFVYFDTIRSEIQRKESDLNWISTMKSAFSSSERLLLISIKSSTTTQWTMTILSQLIESCRSLSVVAVSDCVKILDRLLSDLLFNRFSRSVPLTDILTDSHELVLNSVAFNDISFAGMIEKERSIRAANIESAFAGAAAPLPHEALSFQRGCCGYYRSTSAEVFPTLWSGEFARELLMKEIISSSEMLTSNLIDSVNPSSSAAPVNNVHNLTIGNESLSSKQQSERISLLSDTIFWSKKFKNSVGFWNDVALLIGKWSSASMHTVNPQSSLTLIVDGTSFSHQYEDSEFPFASAHARVATAAAWFPESQVRHLSISWDTLGERTPPVPINSGDYSSSILNALPANELEESLLVHLLADWEVLRSLKRYLLLRKYGSNLSKRSCSSAQKTLFLFSPSLLIRLANMLPEHYLNILQMTESRFQNISIDDILVDVSNETDSSNSLLRLIHARLDARHSTDGASGQSSAGTASDSMHCLTVWFLTVSTSSRNERFQNLLMNSLELIRPFSERVLNCLSTLLSLDEELNRIRSRSAAIAVDICCAESIRECLESFYRRQHFVVAFNGLESSIDETQEFVSHAESYFSTVNVVVPYQDHCGLNGISVYEDILKRTCGSIVSRVTATKRWEGSVRKSVHVDDILQLQGISLTNVCSLLDQTLHLIDKRQRFEFSTFVRPNVAGLSKLRSTSVLLQILNFQLSYLLFARVDDRSAVTGSERVSHWTTCASSLFEIIASNDAVQFQKTFFGGIQQNVGPVVLKVFALSQFLTTARSLGASANVLQLAVRLKAAKNVAPVAVAKVRDPSSSPIVSNPVTVEGPKTDPEHSVLSIIEHQLFGVSSATGALVSSSFTAGAHCASLAATLALVQQIIARSNETCQFATANWTHQQKTIALECVHFVNSTIERFLRHILFIYDRLPSSSTLKQWLVSFIHALFTFPSVKIVDFSLLALPLLSELVLQTTLTPILEDGSLTLSISVSQWFGEKDDTFFRNLLGQCYPWLFADLHPAMEIDVQPIEKIVSGNRDSFVSSGASRFSANSLGVSQEHLVHTFTISNSDTTFVADTCLLMVLQGLESVDCSLRNEALVDKWVLRDSNSRERTAALMDIIFSVDSVSATKQSNKALLLTDDDVYNRIWLTTVQHMTRSVEALCLLMFNVAMSSENVFQESQFSHYDSNDISRHKKFQLFQQEFLVLIFDQIGCDGCANPLDKPESSDNRLAGLFADLVNRFLCCRLPVLISDVAYMQVLWNCYWDLFFGIGSNPNNAQDFHAISHLLDPALTSNHHKGTLAIQTLRVQTRQKLMSSLKLLSFTESLSKSSRHDSKYGFVRTDKHVGSEMLGAILSEGDEEEDEDVMDHEVDEIFASDSVRTILKSCLPVSWSYLENLLAHYQLNGQSSSVETGDADEDSNELRDRDLQSGVFFVRHFEAIVGSLKSNGNGIDWFSSYWTLNSMEKRPDEWIDWIADPVMSVFDMPGPSALERKKERIGSQDDEALNDGSSFYSPLDQIILCAALKPFLLPGVLQTLFCTIGLGARTPVVSRDDPSRWLATKTFMKIPDDFQQRVEIISSQEQSWFNRCRSEDADRPRLRNELESLHHVIVPRSAAGNVKAYLREVNSLFSGETGQSSTGGHLLLTFEDSFRPAINDLMRIDVDALCAIHKEYSCDSLSLLSVQPIAVSHMVDLHVQHSLPLPSPSHRTMARTKLLLAPFDTIARGSLTPAPRECSPITVGNCSAHPGNAIARRLKDIHSFLCEYFSMDHIVDELSDTFPSTEYEVIAQVVISRMLWLLSMFHLAVETYFAGMRMMRSGFGTSRERGKEYENTFRTTNAFALCKTLLPAAQSLLDLLKVTLVTSVAERAVNLMYLISTNADGSHHSSPEVVFTELLCHARGVTLIREVVLQTVYLPVLQASCCALSPTDRQQMETIFASLFTAESIDFTADYRLFNELSLPKLLTGHDVESFFSLFYSFLMEGLQTANDAQQEDVEILELNGDVSVPIPARSRSLHGSGYGNSIFVVLCLHPSQLHQRTLHLMDQGIFRTSQLYLSLHERLSIAPTTSITDRSGVPFDVFTHPLHNFSMFANGAYCPTVLQAVRDQLEIALTNLPLEIDMSLEGMSPAIAAQMKSHRIPDDLNWSNNNKTSNPTGANPTPPFAARNASNTVPSMQRRAGQRAIQRMQSREFDPIWACALMETYQYNRAITTLRTALSRLMEFSLVDWHHYAARSLSNGTRVRCLSRSSQLLDERNSILWDIFLRLFAGYVPTLWLSWDDAYLAAIPFVKLESWFGLMAEKRKMLVDWLEFGDPIPATAKIHLLEDPHGLLHAIRDAFAQKMDTTIDKVFLQFQTLSVTSILLAPTSVVSPKAAGTVSVSSRRSTAVRPNLTGSKETGSSVDATATESSASFYASIDSVRHASAAGCMAYFSGISMFNAVFSGRSKMLELLPDFYSSAFGSEIVLQVAATLDDPRLEVKDAFQCPLYVSSNDIMPQASLSSVLSTLSIIENCSAPSVNTEPLCHVPVPTIESSEDCHLSRAAMYSSPSWIIPV